MKTLATAFAERFKFDPALAYFVGVEREYFITDNGTIVPRAKEVLNLLPQPNFGYELSACQVEDRSGPCPLDELGNRLEENDRLIEKVLATLRLDRGFLEVAPYAMPLDVYPDPTGRYAEITRNMPEEILRAACRVTGTHIHIGMPDHETAVKTYNRVISKTEELCQMGDHTNGERLAIYRIMAPDYVPRNWANWEDFENYALRNGFAEDPRQCWQLIRLSIHGTIEFRMFGSPQSNEEVLKWATVCYQLCTAP